MCYQGKGTVNGEDSEGHKSLQKPISGFSG